MISMMKCGHAANATDSDGQPCCAICAGLGLGGEELAEEPSLEFWVGLGAKDMGDRATVAILEHEESVFLYTHWLGELVPSQVQAALRKRDRWNDGPYLARMVFDEMVGKRTGETGGFGVWSTFMDTNHPVVVLDCDRQKIGSVSEKRAMAKDLALGPESMSFEAFAALDDPDSAPFWTGGEN